MDGASIIPEDDFITDATHSHRATASLIELLLYSENPPKHRVLTAVVKHMTGFTITDAQDLEDDEPHISSGLDLKIKTYGRLISGQRLFNQNRSEYPPPLASIMGWLITFLSDDDLIQRLVNVLMRWVLGNQPTAVEGHMHSTIRLGVGYLKAEISSEFDPNMNHPVYIDEPLAVLAFSSLFQEQAPTARRTWIANSFRTSRNASTSGFIFEEAIMLALMEHLGGKSTALGDIFHFSKSSSLGSSKVSLVALKRVPGRGMQCCPVSWNSGPSDRFGFKAQSPADVLKFLNDPDGKAFLFPDCHMGPDVMCFALDEVTNELILLFVQAKLSKVLCASTWQEAVTSITPEFFYTITVRFQSPYILFHPLIPHPITAVEE